jgi:hypothetical protein
MVNSSRLSICFESDIDIALTT